MTQDKCVYEVCVKSAEASVAIRDYVGDSNYAGSFSAAVVDEQSNNGGVVFTIEVHGDAYEIPVFEEGIAELTGVEVLDADVNIGAAKFA